MRNSTPSKTCMYTGIMKSMWRTSAWRRSVLTSSRFSGVKQNAYFRRTPCFDFSTSSGEKAPRIRPGLFVVPMPMTSRLEESYIFSRRSRTFFRP